MIKKAGLVGLLLLVSACSGSNQASLGPDALRAALQSGTDAQALLAGADAAREDGQFGAALQIYQQILVADPSVHPAELGIAECMLALRQPAEAKAVFDGLAGVKDYRAVALQGRGLALLALGQREPAAKALAEATEADPKLWRAWNALGQLADARRDWAEAAKDYGQAADLNPNSAVVINNQGYSKLLSGDAAGAQAMLRQALSLQPQSNVIQNNLRLAIAADGNYAAALNAAAPQQLAAVLNNVGYMAMRRGDLAAAEGYFAQSMDAGSTFDPAVARNLETVRERQQGGGQ